MRRNLESSQHLCLLGCQDFAGSAAQLQLLHLGQHLYTQTDAIRDWRPLTPLTGRHVTQDKHSKKPVEQEACGRGQCARDSVESTFTSPACAAASPSASPSSMLVSYRNAFLASLRPLNAPTHKSNTYTYSGSWQTCPLCEVGFQYVGIDTIRALSSDSALHCTNTRDPTRCITWRHSRPFLFITFSTLARLSI